MQLSRRDTFSWINIYFDHLWFYHFVQKVNEIWYLRSKIIAFPEYQMSLTSCTKLQTIKCKHLIKSILQEIVPFWKLGHVHVLHVHVIIRKERKKERKTPEAMEKWKNEHVQLFVDLVDVSSMMYTNVPHTGWHWSGHTTSQMN